tara:strand:+ start:166353 stop:167891 length:1539 start_codon:yes stop_codon:yes gene_type:complete
MDKKLDDSAISNGDDVDDPARSSIAGNVTKGVLSLGIVAASVAAFLFLGTGEAPSRKPPPKPVGVAVTTEPIREHRGAVMIETNGVVVPFREISLAAEVRGRVIEQSENLRAGRRVRRGETLIKIDPTEYEIEVRRLESLESQAIAELDALDITVANTKEMLTLSKEELDLQRAELKRVESLRARNASSASEMETAKRAELAARSAVVRVENELRSFAAQKALLEQRRNLTKVELERAKLDLSRTVIAAPVDGMVSRSMVEEQAYVSPGQVFAAIEDASAMEVRCNLTTDEMHWVWNHRDDSKPISAVIRFDIGNRQHQWDAVFERVDGAGIDDNTRTVPCLFRVNNLDSVARFGDDSSDRPQGSQALIRGMFVSVYIETVPDGELFRLPNRAIRPGKRVWLNDAGLLRVAKVDVVSRIEGDTVVQSKQLSSQDQVITSPVPGASDGLTVTTGGGAKGGSAAKPAPGKPADGQKTEGQKLGAQKPGAPAAGGQPPSNPSQNSTKPASPEIDS